MVKIAFLLVKILVLLVEQKQGAGQLVDRLCQSHRGQVLYLEEVALSAEVEEMGSRELIQMEEVGDLLVVELGKGVVAPTKSQEL